MQQASNLITYMVQSGCARLLLCHSGQIATWRGCPGGVRQGSCQPDNDTNIQHQAHFLNCFLRMQSAVLLPNHPAHKGGYPPSME
jgi:hypothetical protein